MRKAVRTIGMLTASVISLTASSSAWAQDAGGPPTDAQTTAEPDSRGVADIIVTARRRSENLQDVPASILAVDAVQLERLNAKSLSDLNGTTPNAKIDFAGSITIRGISSNARNAGFEAGSALYVDGVFQGRPLGNNQDLVDIERVEILRGPQGTLYGKNTTAGAFNITTVRPGEQWTGRFDAQYGEQNEYRLAGYVAGPVVADLVGVKIAGYRRKSDGYQRNITLGETYAQKDSIGGRGEIRFTPGIFDISLRGDIVRDKGNTGAVEPIAGFAVVPGKDTIANNVGLLTDRKGGGASLSADADLGDGYTLSSITAWRAMKVHVIVDDDSSALDAVYHDWHDDYSQFSQEVRLSSPSAGRLNWIVGAYYFHQDLKTLRPVILQGAFPIHGAVDDRVTTKTNSIAVYGNLDYHFTDALTLNLGLRYTKERKTLDFQQFGLPALGYPSLTIMDRFSKGDVSPTAALSYKISPAVTVYAKYGKGFKSGGWNPDLTTTTRIGFGPEKVDNFEGGIRARLFDGRLRLNLTGYYMNYDDLQVSQFLGTFSGYVVTNAGKARIKGAEFDLQAKPASWLTMALGGAINDAKYVDFATGTGVNYKGQQFTNVPKFTGFALADISAPVSDGLKLVAHGDVRYQSKVFFNDQRTVSPIVGAFAQDGYAQANARIGVAFSNGLELGVFVENLTNNRAKIGRSTDALGLGLIVDGYVPPRQFGGRAAFRF